MRLTLDKRRHSRMDRSATQRGVVLIVALVVLVIMSVAGLLMYRATGTGVEIAGNVAFKQNATSLGDLGVEKGRAWLMSLVSTPSTLEIDHAANGYFATWHDGFNPVTYDWSAAPLATEAEGEDTGNKVRYVIHRLCKFAGSTTGPGQQCALPAGGSALGSGGGGAGGAGFSGAVGQPYYRITARVDGPRSTVSYVQVIMF